VRVLAEWRYRVEAGKLAEFARATGLDPVPDRDAPLTFTLAAGAEALEDCLTKLGIDRRRAVHGEQSFEYLKPVRAGMELAATSALTGEESKTGKRGGRMRLLTVLTTFRDAATGEPVRRETMVIVEREGP